MQFSNSALKKLIIPLVIEQFLAVMVGMADIAMVSSAGETAVSSVALVDLINVLILTVFSSLATGGAVVTAQAIGAGDLKRAGHSANQLIYIITAISLIVMALVLLFCRPLLHLLFGSVEPAVMEGAVVYFTISAWSYPFIAVYSGAASLFRAMGNSRLPMYVSALMNALNIAGNAIFVYGFHRGVDGVALSSLFSRAVAAILILGLLHNRHSVIHVEHLLRFRFDLPLMGSILGIGVPSSLEGGVFQLGRVLLVSMISTFGTAQISANAVANNLDNFGVIPGQALGLAMITVAGQCVGAADWDQVRFYVKKLMKITYACIWLLNIPLLLALPLILKLYSLSEQTAWYAFWLVVIHNGSAMLVWPASFTLPNALRAAGDVKIPMAISMGSMMLFRVGGGWLLGVYLGLGVFGVWFAMLIDWAFRTLCFLLRVRRKLWLEHPAPDKK